MRTQHLSTRGASSAALGALAALVASLALVGCDRNDPNKPANADGVVAQAEQKGAEMKSDAAVGMEKAKEAGREMAADVKQAGAQASDKVSDAVITTAVNAELAKDSNLSAMKINVDTDGGRVALKGTAPSTTAKERATTLASSVKGVTSVDNQLKIETGKM